MTLGGAPSQASLARRSGVDGGGGESGPAGGAQSLALALLPCLQSFVVQLLPVGLQCVTADRAVVLCCLCLGAVGGAVGWPAQSREMVQVCSLTAPAETLLALPLGRLAPALSVAASV